MEAVPKLLEGISLLLWPAIVILLIVLFRPVIKALMESAKSRKFTLKIGGQELTMEEASKQQNSLIADLQSQVAEIRRAVGQVSSEGSVPQAQAVSGSGEPSRVSDRSGRSVLWVDDYPKNNSYFVEQLSDVGISVDLALSTTEGLAKFRRGSYLAVISDMGRLEDGKDRPEAGLDLVREIRKTDKQTPILIFCSSRAVHRAGDMALKLGANGVTSSPAELHRLLELDRFSSRY